MRPWTTEGLRLIAAAGLLPLLAACATATPYPLPNGPADAGLVQGTSLTDFLAHVAENTTSIEEVDDKPLKATENSVILPPGHHSFKVRCTATDQVPSSTSPGQTDTESYSGTWNLAFDVEAGHQYQFASDPPASGFGDCVAYVYDSTSGRGPNSEIATVTLDGKQYSPIMFLKLDSETIQGYTRAVVLVDGSYLGTLWDSLFVRGKEGYFSGGGWQQLADFTSWTKLTFTEDADGQFQVLLEDIKQECPGIQVTVISESPDDVTYEFEEASKCVYRSGLSQMGRFLTGPLAVHHVELSSAATLQAADKARWIQALKTIAVSD